MCAAGYGVFSDNEVIGAVWNTIAVQVLMLMGRVAVVIVVLPGGAVNMTAVCVSTAGMGKGSRDEGKSKNNSYKQ